ncbi:MAG: hypothetical protein K8W52_29655 [Deltaproteobacteria bacterium]|nr:hypothetical protein [Deltaproteobacteria bacterium]
MRAYLWMTLACAACADVAQPFDLDHARVMAVRVDPPAIGAGETAHIDALVTDSTITPRVAAATAVDIALPPEAAGFAALLVRTDDGWQLTAPDGAMLAAARAQAGLAADAPLIVALALTVTTLDGPLTATKTVAIGATAANPPAPAILLDGAAAPLTLTADLDAHLTVAAPLPDHDYRWFSSVGDLVGYTRDDARITPIGPGDGWIVVVDRDQAGGTAWTIAPAEVVAPARAR